MNELQATLQSQTAKKVWSWKGDFFVNCKNGLCYEVELEGYDFSKVIYYVQTFQNGNWLCSIDETSLPEGIVKGYDQGIGDFLRRINDKQA